MHKLWKKGKNTARVLTCPPVPKHTKLIIKISFQGLLCLIKISWKARKWETKCSSCHLVSHKLGFKSAMWYRILGSWMVSGVAYSDESNPCKCGSFVRSRNFTDKTPRTFLIALPLPILFSFSLLSSHPSFPHHSHFLLCLIFLSLSLSLTISLSHTQTHTHT